MIAPLTERMTSPGMKLASITPHGRARASHARPGRASPTVRSAPPPGLRAARATRPRAPLQTVRPSDLPCLGENGVDRKASATVPMSTSPGAEVGVLTNTLARALRLVGVQLRDWDPERARLLRDPARAVLQHVRVLVPLSARPARERAQLRLHRDRVRVRRRPRLVAALHVLSDRAGRVIDPNM